MGRLRVTSCALSVVLLMSGLAVAGQDMPLPGELPESLADELEIAAPGPTGTYMPTGLGLEEIAVDLGPSPAGGTFDSNMDLLLQEPAARLDGEVPDFQVGARVEWGGTSDASGWILALEGEFYLGYHFAITAMIVHYRYEWDNGESLAPGNEAEEEEGNGTGIGAEIRWYAGQQERFSGFYVGLGVSVFFAADWENKEDKNQDGVYQASEIEEGDDTASEIHFSLGYSFRLTPKFSISPSAIVGSYLSKSPGAGFFAGIGFHISFGF